MDTRAVVVFCLVAVATTFALYGTAIESFEYAAFELVLSAASLSDLRTRTIPNVCIVLCIAIRLAYFVILGVQGSFDVIDGAFYVASGVGMYALLLVFTMVFEQRSGRQGMGGGDLKLLGLGGLYFGFEAGLGIIFISCLMALGASALSAQDESHRPAWARKDETIRLSRTLPFGPAISIACLIVILATAGAA